MGARIAAFACGVIILYSGLFPPPRALSVSVICLTLMATAALRWRRGRGRHYLVMAICLVLGLAWAALASQGRLEDRLASALEGRELSVTGYLCDAPSPGAWDSVRFSLCLTGDRTDRVPRR